jgi:hypothetical protein
MSEVNGIRMVAPALRVEELRDDDPPHSGSEDNSYGDVSGT